MSLPCVRKVPAAEFRAVYDAWYGEVFRWVRLMGAPQAYREDLAQDVFLIVHRRLPEFDGQNLGGWLYQITRRRVRDFRQGLWYRNLLAGSSLAAENLVEVRVNPAESLEAKRTWALLDQLLAKLKPHERVALVLFELEGYSGEEISQIQGVSIHTVFSRLRRARRRLRVSLSHLATFAERNGAAERQAS